MNYINASVYRAFETMPCRVNTTEALDIIIMSHVLYEWHEVSRELIKVTSNFFLMASD